MASQNVNKQHIVIKFYPLLWNLFSEIQEPFMLSMSTSQVNSYGHGGSVSSPNNTFSWANLNKQLTSSSCTLYFRLKLTKNPPWMNQQKGGE